MRDFITLFSPLSGAVAKRLTPSGPLAAEHETWHRATVLELDSFQDLARVLTGLMREPLWHVVRGRLIAEDPARCRRTHVQTPPSLVDAPHHWALLDLDKYRPELKPEDFAADPARYAAEARAALPEPFRGAACFWAATGSAGIKPGARLRLGFWFTRPVADAQLKAWVATWAIPIDDSLFTPSQPCYTAAPVCDPGVTDPVDPTRRCGVLEGEPEVVPYLARGERELAASDDLAKAARRVARTAEGERRSMLNRLAYVLAKAWAPEELPREDIAKALSRAAGEAQLEGWIAEKTLQDALADGTRDRAIEFDGWRKLLLRDKTGKPEDTPANVSLYLEHHETWRGTLRWDTRALAPEWVRAPAWRDGPGQVDDSDTTHIGEWFQTKTGLVVKSPAWIKAGLVKAAKLNPFDPLEEYLDKLPAWDGVSRAETFFIRHLGVADTPLTRAQSLVVFNQAVRRARATLEAPVQADYVLILSGAQGLRKSSVWRALCPVGRLFRDDLPDVTSKDARVAVVDSWICELAEVVLRRADAGAVKAFITARVDKFRPPYGANEITVPRRCVIVGSANENEYLTDPTGNRRWYTFVCTRRADMDEVMAERDQIWAEAVARVARNERPYLNDALEAQAAEVAEAHTLESPWESALAVALARAVFAGDFAAGQLDESKVPLYLTAVQASSLVSGRHPSVAELKAVKDALRSLGWAEVRLRSTSGKRVRYWVRPGVDPSGLTVAEGPRAEVN